MGKKVKQKKKAVFELEPDGFSIHTFELSRQLSKHEWKQLKDALYRQQEQSSQKGWIYKDKYDIHRCTLYAKHGIRIGLEHHNEGDVHTYFIRIVVNPRRLIDPKSSYLGILPPRKESIEKLRYAFQQLFHETPFDKDINSYKLSRLAYVQIFPVIRIKYFGSLSGCCVNYRHLPNMSANTMISPTRKRQTNITNTISGFPAVHMNW